MVNITAKVYCTYKEEDGEGGRRHARLSFSPDYQDGRNQEWAVFTPSLSLQMTVKGDVADHFAPGGRYTLTFTPEP